MTRIIWWLDTLSAAMNIFTAGYLYLIFSDLISRLILVPVGAVVIIILLVQIEKVAERSKKRTANMLESGAGEFSS
ncbi:MAG: hypothetical protein IPH75_05820 [bacterium]|nr:hypothetical protein [bacterium]